MIVHDRIEISEEQLADICRRYHVRELSLFGSVLRDDFGNDSDIDVLVAFEPDAQVGLFKYYDLQQELQQLLGRSIDLVPKDGLKPIIRDEVLATAEVIFGP